MLKNPSKYSLSDLAERFHLELRGQGSTLISGVGTLRSATPSQVSFLANPGYRAELPSTQAGAVILKSEDAEACPTNCLVSPNPYLAYARLAGVFGTNESGEPGIHASAVVHPTASLGAGVSIGPNAVIGARCVIGPGTTIGAGSVIDTDCELGTACRIHANVTLAHKVRLGDRVIVHPGAVIGGDGFGIAFAGDHWEKVPQLGGVRVGHDCEIGANTTIDRGAIDDTILEEDVRVDNLVQIAHNVFIGAHTAIAAMVGIAGSAKIGRNCLLAGRCGIQGHVEIADGVTVAACSVAYYSITEPGSTWSSLIPAQPLKEWQRNLSRLRKLDELARRIMALGKNTGRSNDND